MTIALPKQTCSGARPKTLPKIEPAPARRERWARMNGETARALLRHGISWQEAARRIGCSGTRAGHYVETREPKTSLPLADVSALGPEVAIQLLEAAAREVGHTLAPLPEVDGAQRRDMGAVLAGLTGRLLGLVAYLAEAASDGVITPHEAGEIHNRITPALREVVGLEAWLEG